MTEEWTPDSVEPRALTPGLLLGILFFPILFVWLLLRPGYANSVRMGAAIYVGLGIIFVIVKQLT